MSPAGGATILGTGIIESMHPDQPTVGPPAASPSRRPSWSATSWFGRAFLVAACLLLAGAVLVFLQARRLTPSYRVRAVRGPQAVSVDAAGCPVGATCRPVAGAPPAMLAAIRRAFPTSKLASSTGVFDAATGKAFRVQVVAELPGAGVLTLTAQRLPGLAASDPPDFDRSDRSHVDLSGNVVIESQTVRSVVPGAPGCSLVVTVHYPGGGSPFDADEFRLANDPKAQLTP